MTRSIRLHKISVLLTVLAVTLTLASQSAQAQVKPFKVTGAGLAPNGISLIPKTPAFHWAIGTATELGKYFGEGNFQLIAPPVGLNADFSSAPDFTFVAANGDKLVFTYGDTNNGAKQSGKVTLTVVGMTPAGAPIFTAVFVAEFNPVPAKCTGRFQQVSAGSFIMIAKSKPFSIVGAQTTPFEYSWQGDGWIQYAQGNRAKKR